MLKRKYEDTMNRMKTILLLALIVIVVVLPVTGENETSTEYGNIPYSKISPTPIWSDLIGTENVPVSCSHDGKYVIAGSDSGVLRMYDWTGKILWTYRNTSKSVTSVSIAGSGEYAAAAFYFPYPYDGEILYFNRNGTDLWKYPQLSEQRNNIAMSENGSITVMSVEKELTLVDNSGVIITKTTMPDDICQIVVSDDGTTSAVASNSRCPWRGALGSISGVDSKGKILFIFPIDLSFIDIGISGNGERIVGVDENNLYAFGKDGTLLWNYSSNPRFRSVAISSDGEYISAGSQYYVRYFNRTGALLWDYYDDEGWVNAVSISGNGNFVFAGASKKIVLLDKTGALLWQYTTPSDVISVSSSRDGYYFTAGTKDKVYFFNRWGNATIIGPVVTLLPSMNQSANNLNPVGPVPNTTLPAPLALTSVIFAIGAISAIVLIQKKRNGP